MNVPWEGDSVGITAPSVEMLKSDPARFEAFRLSYYKEWDFLYLRSPLNPPAATVPIGQIGWLRYDPMTLDIVGADVEDFEGVFLVSHPFLKADWREIKRYVSTSALAMMNGADLATPPDSTVDKSVKVLVLQVMDCLTAPQLEEFVS